MLLLRKNKMKRFQKYNLVRTNPASGSTFIKPIFHIQLNNAKVIKLQKQSRGHSATYLPSLPDTFNSSKADSSENGQKKNNSGTSFTALSNANSQPSSYSIAQQEAQGPRTSIKENKTSSTEPGFDASKRGFEKTQEKETLNESSANTSSADQGVGFNNNDNPPDPPSNNINNITSTDTNQIDTRQRLISPFSNTIHPNANQNGNVVSRNLRRLQTLLPTLQSEPMDIDPSNTVNNMSVNENTPLIRQSTMIPGQNTPSFIRKPTEPVSPIGQMSQNNKDVSMLSQASSQNIDLPSLADATNNSSLQSTFDRPSSVGATMNSTAQPAASTLQNETASSTQATLNSTGHDQNEFSNLPNISPSNSTDLFDSTITNGNMSDTITPSDPTSILNNISIKPHATTKELLATLPSISPDDSVQRKKEYFEARMAKREAERLRAKQEAERLRAKQEVEKLRRDRAISNLQKITNSTPYKTIDEIASFDNISRISNMPQQVRRNLFDVTKSRNQTPMETNIDKSSSAESEQISKPVLNSDVTANEFTNSDAALQPTALINSKNIADQTTVPISSSNLTETNNISNPTYSQQPTLPIETRVQSDQVKSNVLEPSNATQSQPINSTPNESGVLPPSFQVNTQNTALEPSNATQSQPINSTPNISSAPVPLFQVTTQNPIQNSTLVNSNNTIEPDKSENSKNTFQTGYLPDGYITPATLPIGDISKTLSNSTSNDSDDDVFTNDNNGTVLSNSYGIANQENMTHDQISLNRLNKLKESKLNQVPKISQNDIGKDRLTLNNLNELKDNKIKRKSEDVSSSFFDHSKLQPEKVYISSKPKVAQAERKGSKRSTSDVTFTNDNSSPKRTKGADETILEQFNNVVRDKLTPNI